MLDELGGAFGVEAVQPHRAQVGPGEQPRQLEARACGIAVLPRGEHQQR
jgi:hypothetical protein